MFSKQGELDLARVLKALIDAGDIEPRPGFRGGQLVDHGPEGVRQGYAVNWTPERLANRQTWMDNTGSTLEDYNKLPYDTRSNIRFGRITGIKQTAEFGKQKESAATKEFRNWLSKQDPKTLTSESVDDLIKQSKIKTTSRTRPGLVMAINRITEEKEFAKFKNIQLGRAYSQENINQLSDDLLKAYAKDDITLVMDPKHKTSISDIRINRRSALDKAIKNTGLDEETIFNLLDDRDAYVALEKKQATTKGRPVEEGKAKFYKQAENWIIKNSKRYEDPDKFKKAFTRTFGKDNHLIQRISKGTATSIPFSDWFRTSIMGTSEQAMRGQVKPTYTSSQLDNIFKTAIYTNNKNVRDKITKEIKNILPESASKRIPDVRKALNESLLLKKFGLNYEIKGPIARLLAKEIGDDLIKKISLFRKPWLGTPELLTYLKDIVDPKYQSMFEESIKAIKYAQKNQWPEAKKALNLSQSIMFDHKIPKALIGLGYADEIEYIKLHPTSQQFNAIIKNSEFDKPLVKLTKKWAEAETPNAKAKVVGEMNELKDNFSKKYGGYLDEVTITPDKTGKPIFSSTTDVVTKDTDLVRSLETSLQHEKFPTMSKSKQTEFLQLLKTAKTAKGPARLKAMQAIIATVGTAAAASLFDKFGIQTAMADTGAAAPGVTAGDIALAGAAPLATKKGRSLYGKAAKAALKSASTVPGILAIEAAVGPGIVSAMGGSFGEAIASPLLLEGTVRNKRIYDKLKEQGFSERDIEAVKDSLMLEADPFTSSMMPVSEAATNAKVRSAASEAYDWASGEIAKEDEARLERADKFNYLQDIGFAGGGLTRTVAPDSGPMSRGLRSLYIDDMD